jgi:pyruvate formate lyase activating enzyme
MNPAIYKSHTGRDNALVKENLATLLSLVGSDRVTVRVPLIPHYNTEEDVERSVAELTSMGVTLVDRFVYRLPKDI